VRRWLLLDGAVVCQMHAKPGWLLLGEYQPVPTINLSPAGQAGQCRHRSKLTAIATGAHTLIVPGTIVWLEESNFAKLFRRQFVARNSAFVSVGGQEIFGYDKHNDAGKAFEAEQANAKFRSGRCARHGRIPGLRRRRERLPRRLVSICTGPAWR
jgi:hypothetical protein